METSGSWGKAAQPGGCPRSGRARVDREKNLTRRATEVSEEDKDRSADGEERVQAVGQGKRLSAQTRVIPPNTPSAAPITAFAATMPRSPSS